MTSATGLYVPHGEDLELTCTEEVPNGVKFDFKWILPNDGIAVKVSLKPDRGCHRSSGCVVPNIELIVSPFDWSDRKIASKNTCHIETIKSRRDPLKRLYDACELKMWIELRTADCTSAKLAM